MLGSIWVLYSVAILGFPGSPSSFACFRKVLLPAADGNLNPPLHAENLKINVDGASLFIIDQHI